MQPFLLYLYVLLASIAALPMLSLAVDPGAGDDLLLFLHKKNSTMYTQPNTHATRFVISGIPPIFKLGSGAVHDLLPSLTTLTYVDPSDKHMDFDRSSTFDDTFATTPVSGEAHQLTPKLRPLTFVLAALASISLLGCMMPSGGNSGSRDFNYRIPLRGVQRTRPTTPSAPT